MSAIVVDPEDFNLVQPPIGRQARPWMNPGVMVSWTIETNHAYTPVALRALEGLFGIIRYDAGTYPHIRAETLVDEILHNVNYQRQPPIAFGQNPPSYPGSTMVLSQLDPGGPDTDPDLIWMSMAGWVDNPLLFAGAGNFEFRLEL